MSLPRGKGESLRLTSASHPIWTAAGWLLIVGTLVASAYSIARGPKIIPPQGDVFSGTPKGVRGTISEDLDRGRFVLGYETIEGQESDLRLKGVSGVLQEPETRWNLTSPAGERQEGKWTLDAPLHIKANSPDGHSLGFGRVDGPGPAVRWQRGAWEGLAPLHWENLEGGGMGRWDLPTGWQRFADGHFEVDHGPVRWEPTEKGPFQHVEANSLWAKAGFQEGTMKDVVARTEDGTIHAELAQLTPTTITWPSRLRFERNDGWSGEAAGGFAPRPAPGQSVDRIELRQVQAHRTVPGGTETLLANGARWTREGLLLEGSVTWDQPLDGSRLTLKAPRIARREAPGPGLAQDLPIGAARAEGMALLTWGRSSLSSPSIEAIPTSSSKGVPSMGLWHLSAPVLGRSEEGTFFAASASGGPRAWVFQGPVEAQLFNGGVLRGSRLLWEEGKAGALPSWSLNGSPATWTRYRERLSGLRILRQGVNLRFPDGITGALAADSGDLSLRAEQGDYDPTRIQLNGHVECLGLGWGLKAERITVHLGLGRIVKSIRAEGGVILKGHMGEGRGEALDLDLGAQVAKWQGRVRGLAESPAF